MLRLPLAGGDFSVIYDLRNTPFRSAPRRRGWIALWRRDYHAGRRLPLVGGDKSCWRGSFGVLWMSAHSHEGMNRCHHLDVSGMYSLPLVGGDESQPQRLAHCLNRSATRMRGWIAWMLWIYFSKLTCLSYEGMFRIYGQAEKSRVRLPLAGGDKI